MNTTTTTTTSTVIIGICSLIVEFCWKTRCKHLKRICRQQNTEYKNNNDSNRNYAALFRGLLGVQERKRQHTFLLGFKGNDTLNNHFLRVRVAERTSTQDTRPKDRQTDGRLDRRLGRLPGKAIKSVRFSNTYGERR